MIDCIAGYHLNPWTCGIAKFNAILARRLDLPVVRIGSPELTSYRRPLLSLKMSEFSAEDALALDTWIERHAGEFELFLHAFGECSSRFVITAQPTSMAAFTVVLFARSPFSKNAARYVQSTR